MKAQYKDGNQAGFGELIFSGALFPDEPWSIAIQRASDRKFLTGKKHNPWVGETIFLTRTGQVLADGTLAIAIGPDVVDQLDPQEQYALILRGDGPEEKARLRVNNITYSAANGLTAPQPPAAETPLPPPIQTETAPHQQPVAQTTQPQAQAQSVEHPAEPLQLPSRQTASKSRLWLWFLSGLLALAAIGVFMFLQSNRQTEEVPAVKKEEAFAPKPDKPKQQAPKQEYSVEDRVRKFFAGGTISPRGAAELAAKLPKNTPAEQDAVYRLWYFAAENGETSVLLMYGECLDPSMPQFGSIEKNGVESWTAYMKLRESQPQKADAAMRHLKDWLEKAAARGDAKARAWLAQIKHM